MPNLNITIRHFCIAVGTLGMDPQASYTMEEETPTKLREATGGAYTASLKVSKKHCASLPTRVFPGGAHGVGKAPP